MTIEISALRAIPEFSALEDTELGYVRQVTRERQIHRGELLLIEGERPPGIHRELTMDLSCPSHDDEMTLTVSVQ